MLCPICKKGNIFSLAGLLVCCSCKKAWKEHEFLADINKAGLAYYFTPDINGEIVIYDPKIEQHKFIEAH